MSFTSVALFKKNADVKGAEKKEFTYQATAIPNDPLYSNQWQLPKINAPSGWDTTTGDGSTIIAVLDTGFQLNHEDLSSKFLPGYDFVGGDNDPSLDPPTTYTDTNGVTRYKTGKAFFHGTFTAGMVAAASNNTKGVAGTCWDCKIMPIRVLDDDGIGTTDVIAEGIRYAADNGAKVISMSFGYSNTFGEDSYLKNAIDYASGKGVVLVAAAGNTGDTVDSGINYPAAYGNVLAVGAVNKYNQRASWSCYGPELDLMAPGVSVFAVSNAFNSLTGTFSTSSYDYSSGTSFAAPQVAAAAGLLFSENSELTNQDVTALLEYHASKIGGSNFSNSYGYGLLDLSSAFLPVLPGVTSSLAFSNLNPVEGQTLTANYTLENPTSKDITIEAGLADQNTQSGAWNSFSAQSVTIPADSSRQLTFNKTVLYNGPHRTWIAVGYNGVWYNAKPQNNQLVSYSYTVKPVTSAISVASSLGFSDLDLTAGQNLTASFRLYNSSSSPISLSVGVPDMSYANGKWNSFSTQNATVPANGSVTASFTKKVKYVGTHHSWIAIGVNGVWSDAKPKTNQLVGYTYNVRTPNIRLDQYSFSTLPPKPKQQFTAKVRVTNLEKKPINLDFIAVPIYNPYTNVWKTMNYSAANVTLAAGQQNLMNVTQTLPSSYYRIWPSIIAGDSSFTPLTKDKLEMYWCGWI